MAVKVPCYDYQAAAQGKEKDFGLTAAEIRPMWEYMKARYLDQGFSYEDTINAVANQFKIPHRMVEEIMTGPKTMPRAKTAAIYAKEDARRSAMWKAQLAIDNARTPLPFKALYAVGQIPRSVLTAFHGGVFPVTHAGGLLLRPSAWGSFLKGARVSWGGLSKAFYEKERIRLAGEDNYAAWRQAGLRIGVDERAQGVLSGWLGNRPGWSNRSWLGLMRMRYELAENAMSRYSFKGMTAAEKLDVMKNISEVVNHSTGVTGSQMFGKFSKALFAPQLTASKVARVTTDPAKTLGTFYKMATGRGA